ncbi:MAG: hypothetical protein G8237_09730 [Magnetococcales bacterium]|nr:hypothetical protein [Magnetococcales bacterium]NGZ06623.1 hypothetical protein [Magnetococcales bacterium]
METKPVSRSGARWVRSGLLALLPLLALAIHVDGQRYDPGLLDFKNAAARLSPVMRFFPEQMAGLVRLGELKRFTKENLHDYVNGHAEYYLSAGFGELLAGEYGLAAEASRPRVVVDVFDMTRPLFAFGVLTGESGDGGQEVAIGDMGLAEPGGLRFIVGPYYVKLTGFVPDVPLLAMGKELAQTMGQGNKGSVEVFAFPAFGPVVATKFIKEKYRGVAFLNQVVERSFRIGEQIVPVFQVMGSATQSQELEGRLLEFLRKEEIPVERVERADLAIFLVRDPYEGEWFFLRVGERLLGVFGLPLDVAWGPLQEFVAHDQKKDNGAHGSDRTAPGTAGVPEPGGWTLRGGSRSGDWRVSALQ